MLSDSHTVASLQLFVVLVQLFELLDGGVVPFGKVLHALAFLERGIDRLVRLGRQWLLQVGNSTVRYDERWWFWLG